VIKLKVSLCITVLNELDSIPQMARDLSKQTMRPDEIVVVDGGSEDGTVDKITEQLETLAPLLIHTVPGANIATGRNLCMGYASGDIIVFLDAGLGLGADWLRSLVAAVDLGADVAYGVVLPDPVGIFEHALAAVTLPQFDEIDSGKYFPSGGSMAGRKDLYQNQPFPEWLDHGEDMWLDLKWRSEGLELQMVPEAIVTFRPRRSIRQFYKQYYNYARGDGVAGMWLYRHGLRFVSYAALLTILLKSAEFWFLWPPLMGLGFWYQRLPFKRWRKSSTLFPLKNRVFGILLILFIRVVGDAAKIVGFISGSLIRMRRWKWWHP